jgi:hypothetical protein
VPDKKIPSVTIEGARIIFRNFSGSEGRFNAKGKRNFNVLLDDEIAAALIEDGWNVKHLRPREEDEEPQARLEVAVSFTGRPIRIVMITSRGKTALDESTVGILDWAQITKADLIIRPYQWEVNGKTGVKAYLQSIFVTIYEDALELKYAGVPDVPDSAMSTMVANVEEFEKDSAPF